MAATSKTVQTKETKLKRTAEYGLKCLYSDLIFRSSNIYTILRRKTYGYFEKRRKVRYKIILVAAVLLMMALIRELKNMEADNE